MKRNAVCIFAHPDDESFGPSGTIHLLTKTHNVYVICLTNGDSGENYLSGDIDLAAQRQNEIQASTQVLGVKKVFFLNYGDGSLANGNYHEIAADIQKILDDLRPDTIMTFEHRGVSGHIDHVTTAMVASYLFERLSYIRKIMFYALLYDQLLFKPGEYFIYHPPGYKKDEIDVINDVSHLKDLKIRAIKKHLSQQKDMNRILNNLRLLECFYVWEKEPTSKASESPT